MCVCGVFVWAASWKAMTDTETVVEQKELKSQHQWKLIRKCQKRGITENLDECSSFLKFVEYDIMPGSGQIPSLSFWTDCKLCGSLLKCSGINHYPRQCVYTHVIPHKWIAISFFFAFLSRPSRSEVLKDERNTELVSTFIIF